MLLEEGWRVMGIQAVARGSSTSVEVDGVMVEGEEMGSPRGPGARRRDQVVVPIRLDQALSADVEAVLSLRVRAWEVERARCESKRVARSEWPDRPSRHGVMLDLLRVGIRERLRARGSRDKGRGARS